MACCCMGPQNGEPLCPCMMRAAAGWLAPLSMIPTNPFTTTVLAGTQEREVEETTDER